ncbi:hypothetical protein, partial [Pseudoalteromonas sp.]|uniref:hypothetical protein n=1 Tax=Pseudoalteromonas sp. TaxID=53249 RepID=UPI002615C87B
MAQGSGEGRGNEDYRIIFINSVWPTVPRPIFKRNLQLGLSLIVSIAWHKVVVKGEEMKITAS